MIRARHLLALIVLAAASVEAREILDVNVPEKITVSGRELTLNGAGVRTATMLRVKVYVASFYAPTPLSTPAEVAASTGPLRFNFCFLRAFNQAKTQEAWKWQFEQSGEHTYEGFDRDLAAFIGAFGPLKKFGVESVEIEGTETRVYDDGALKARIPGRDFQKAFLSLWFGSKPVMLELKAALLGKKSGK